MLTNLSAFTILPCLVLLSEDIRDKTSELKRRHNTPIQAILDYFRIQYKI
jgi:hypothetical protein